MTPSARRALSLRVLCAPAVWPHWPFLPVARRRNGLVQLGVVFDARPARLTGYSATVFLTCLFVLPTRFEQFLTLPKEVFDCAEELLDAGWEID